MEINPDDLADLCEVSKKVIKLILEETPLSEGNHINKEVIVKYMFILINVTAGLINSCIEKYKQSEFIYIFVTKLKEMILYQDQVVNTQNET